MAMHAAIASLILSILCTNDVAGEIRIANKLFGGLRYTENEDGTCQRDCFNSGPECHLCARSPLVLTSWPQYTTLIAATTAAATVPTAAKTSGSRAQVVFPAISHETIAATTISAGRTEPAISTASTKTVATMAPNCNICGCHDCNMLNPGMHNQLLSWK